MNVLPYRARRFIRHNLTWNNIRFQWSAVGLIITLTGIACGYAVEYFTSSIMASTIVSTGVTVTFAAPFFYSAMEFPFPQNEPWIVQKYGDFKHRWYDATRPGYYAAPQSGGSLKIIRPVFCDFSEVYDLNGYLIGHEQDVWTDGNWTFKPVADDSQSRMPRIAFWRTKRQKPASNQAEVLSGDEVVGHTTYSEL